VTVTAHPALVFAGFSVGVAQHLGGAGQLGRRLPGGPLHVPLRAPVEAGPPPPASGGPGQPGGHGAQLCDHVGVAQRVGSGGSTPVAGVLDNVGERRDDRQRVVAVRWEGRGLLLVILARRLRLGRRPGAGRTRYRDEQDASPRRREPGQPGAQLTATRTGQQISRAQLWL
jgi:hypothetical protein